MISLSVWERRKCLFCVLCNTCYCKLLKVLKKLTIRLIFVSYFPSFLSIFLSSIERPHIYHLLHTVSSNLSSHAHEYPDCQEGGNEASLLVSPLVVAGIVIGLVLFLSCVTIIVGSLRKDSRLRNPHLHASYGQWSNFMGSTTHQKHTMLRSTCVEDFPPAFDFDSYVETLSQVNVMYPDSPPHYDECVGQGTQIYVPTDDPPPYSLTDPCREHPAPHPSGSSHYPTRLQDFRHQPIASISLSALPLDEAPPYEAVVSEQNHPLPLMPLDLLKHTTAESSPQDSVSHRIL
uniref:Protein BEAN1-like n=1 Tax=Sinocyclocheilus rhinocerous TaxID=307959 RepID=A0A673HAN4_9TELE